MEKKKKAPVFRPYDQSIMPLLPPSWDDFISANHPVRVVNDVINKISLKSLESEYQGGGRANYHPRVLLKLVVFGYLSNIYSSRKLESFARENIHCMWLTALQQPDHNTINRFRSTRLKNPLKEIFAQVVELLMESGHVSLQDVYVDGTKLESNANKYTFVWGKSIKGYKAKIGQQLKEIWSYAEGVAREEMQQLTAPDFQQVDAEMVKKTIETINTALEEKKIAPEVKKKLNYGKKNWENNVKRYEAQEEILGQRNSYSKTDPDATFMRMKEDHMMNGQLKPGYNVQISTNNQIVLDYSLHPKPSDSTTLIAHVGGMIDLYGRVPENLIADAGYGSEENYRFLEEQKINAYVKYNLFDKERKNGKKSTSFSHEHLHYNQEKNCYYCPMGQQMKYIGKRTRKTENGYLQESRVYQAVNCKGCPLRGACHKAKGPRVIEINDRLIGYRKEAEKLLTSQQGVVFRKKRCWDVEPVFGNIKQNKGFRRFLLRGIEKVATEIGLVFLSHNLKKSITAGFRLMNLQPA